LPFAEILYGAFAVRFSQQKNILTTVASLRIFISMKDEVAKAIEVLRQKITSKEDEATKLKQVVNEFCADENEPPIYPNITTDSVSAAQLRSDQFYGDTLSGAARTYLEMRKASGGGAASVEEIYQALKAGGYSFDTKNETNARNGVRLALRKNSVTFHKLPNGQYGLCSWYGVKGAKPEDVHARRKRGGGKRRKRNKTATPSAPTAVPKAQNGQAAISDAKTMTRFGRTAEASVSTPSGGSITVQQLTDRVRKKSSRINVIARDFGVDEGTIKKMLEPTSNVYVAERGWLKVRE
jgi:hypothetical protein